jgi:hypothetical protein
MLHFFILNVVKLLVKESVNIHLCGGVGRVGES